MKRAILLAVAIAAAARTPSGSKRTAFVSIADAGEGAPQTPTPVARTKTATAIPAPQAAMRVSAYSVKVVQAFRGHEWYVSPIGTPRGNGSMRSPWDYQTACNKTGTINGGDTVWMRTTPGPYVMPQPSGFSCELTARSPVRFAPYPPDLKIYPDAGDGLGPYTVPHLPTSANGGVKILSEGGTTLARSLIALKITSSNVWYFDFEIGRDGDFLRELENSDGNQRPDGFASCIEVDGNNAGTAGSHNRIINPWMHDCSNVAFKNGLADGTIFAEWLGSSFGWDNVHKSPKYVYGQFNYGQNGDATHRPNPEVFDVRAPVCMGPIAVPGEGGNSYCVQIYTTGAASLQNIRYVAPYTRGRLILGGTTVDRLSWLDGQSSTGGDHGYGSKPCSGNVLSGNLFTAAPTLPAGQFWSLFPSCKSGVTATGNTLVGDQVKSGWTAPDFPNNTYATDDSKMTPRALVWPSEYFDGVGRVYVYNPLGAPALQISLAGIGIPEGAAFEIHQGYDLPTIYASGIYHAADPWVAVPLDPASVTVKPSNGHRLDGSPWPSHSLPLVNGNLQALPLFVYQRVPAGAALRGGAAQRHDRRARDVSLKVR